MVIQFKKVLVVAALVSQAAVSLYAAQPGYNEDRHLVNYLQQQNYAPAILDLMKTRIPQRSGHWRHIDRDLKMQPCLNTIVSRRTQAVALLRKHIDNDTSNVISDFIYISPRQIRKLMTDVGPIDGPNYYYNRIFTLLPLLKEYKAYAYIRSQFPEDERDRICLFENDDNDNN